MAKNKQVYTLRLDPELIEAIKLAAVEAGASEADLVRSALAEKFLVADNSNAHFEELVKQINELKFGVGKALMQVQGEIGQLKMQLQERGVIE